MLSHQGEHPSRINVHDLFDEAKPSSRSPQLESGGLKRFRADSSRGDIIVLDQFQNSAVSCCFVRLGVGRAEPICFWLNGSYRLDTSAAGGWLISSSGHTSDSFWLPCPPVFRSVGSDGHILSEKPVNFTGVRVEPRSISVDIDTPPNFCFDWCAWKISNSEVSLLRDLRKISVQESQPVFLWGSHTIYREPADVYKHLIFGHIYENRFAWPYNRKICSENDAHALYVTLHGLQQSTGKQLYSLLKKQLIISVLSRQSRDGGWYHGEWTNDMEAHLRLNASAIHLLLDSFEERNDPFVRQALDKALDFIAQHKDDLKQGSWFLHDSLELQVESMKKSPFRWCQSRVFEKSPSNMLVLNTHLDTTVLFDRYRQITGEQRYIAMVESALVATRVGLNARSAEVLYYVLFKLINLTFLPTRVARNLPLPIRALKRMTSKYLIPQLHRIKAIFPRLLMPGGYIDRALSLQGLADSYHSINVMDLARYWRRFPKEDLNDLLSDALEFVQTYDVLDHWAERIEKRYALGFWAEALYHMNALNPLPLYRRYLAETILKLEDTQLGLPPTLLGANAEAVPTGLQVPCLSLADSRLRVANLGWRGHAQFMIVNPTDKPISVDLVNERHSKLAWENTIGVQIQNCETIEVAPRGWIFGQQTIEIEANTSCASV